MDIRCDGLVDRRGLHVRSDFRRADGQQLRAIILHQTAGSSFLARNAQRRLASPNGGAIRLDQISAHFVVLQNGVIYYTHDVADYRSGSAGRNAGIDIEFAGSFPSGRVPDAGRRAPADMIKAGRRLVAALAGQVSGITHIHPHGQVQGRQRSDDSVCGGRDSPNPCGSLGSCPGPDIWMNVGRWACLPSGEGGCGLICDTPLAGLGYPLRGIDDQQLNPAYLIDGPAE